ncbi:MAG: AraC family transcriptional regulator ligand-binding domain-containing protein [Chitinivorax sp.]
MPTQPKATRPPRAPLAGSVPGTYARLLFDYLAARGLDSLAILGEAAPPAGHEPSYPAERWRQLLAQAADHLHDPALGLHLGASITPAHLGPLGYVLAASSNASAALQRYLRYQRLVHDVSPVRYELSGDELILEWNDDSRAIGPHANQCGLAALVQFARQIAAPDTTPLAVYFVEPAPANPAPYADFFGCPVSFEQPATRIRFAASLLQQPLRQPDATLATLLQGQVDALLAALPQQDHLLNDIRRRLSRRLLQGEPALEHIAADLHLSGRTLRRRLQQQGWHFRQLLEDTRRHLAEDYLRDPRLTLPDVALLLGYSEQSAFNRAFRRWTGQTPRMWQTGQGS